MVELIGTMAAGFGSSTIFLPLALFFVDFKKAIVLVAIFHLLGNTGRIVFFRQGFDRRIIIQFGVPSGSIMGFVTALVGTGGALRAALLQGLNIEKMKYIATAATIAVATDVTRIPIYIFHKAFSQRNTTLSASAARHSSRKLPY